MIIVTNRFVFVVVSSKTLFRFSTSGFILNKLCYSFPLRTQPLHIPEGSLRTGITQPSHPRGQKGTGGTFWQESRPRRTEQRQKDEHTIADKQ